LILEPFVIGDRYLRLHEGNYGCFFQVKVVAERLAHLGKSVTRSVATSCEITPANVENGELVSDGPEFCIERLVLTGQFGKSHSFRSDPGLHDRKEDQVLVRMMQEELIVVLLEERSDRRNATPDVFRVQDSRRVQEPLSVRPEGFVDQLNEDEIGLGPVDHQDTSAWRSREMLLTTTNKIHTMNPMIPTRNHGLPFDTATVNTAGRKRHTAPGIATTAIQDGSMPTDAAARLSPMSVTAIAARSRPNAAACRAHKT
jgi:hypothetical protein